jgi:hypothetical protein
MQRDYPIFLHCQGCRRCAEHHMIFDGAEYVDLVCQTCGLSAMPQAKPLEAFDAA